MFAGGVVWKSGKPGAGRVAPECSLLPVLVGVIKGLTYSDGAKQCGV
jgi:hypothetical protein